MSKTFNQAVHESAQEIQIDILDTLVDHNALSPLQRSHVDEVLQATKAWREMTGSTDDEAVILFTC